MTFPRLTELEALGGGCVLARLDLNVPLNDGEVMDATRVEASVQTLRWLLDRGAQVAACSHLGKAKGKPIPEFSLAPVAPVLEGLLQAPVKFVADCVGETVDSALEAAPPGTVLLLENLRFHPGEKANDIGFARQLSAPFTHYVNDAFGTAHRAHASVEAASRLFPRYRRAAGHLMQIELDAIVCLMNRPDKPFVAVVGGAKASTKTKPLVALLERVDALAIGGGMANTFFLAQGWSVGRSLVEQDMVAAAQDVLRQASETGVELLIPNDVIITDEIDNPARIETTTPDAIPDDMMVVDIGPETRARYAAALVPAMSAFWNGPMGVFEVGRFADGTLSVARAMAECAGFTVAGGGESVMAIHRAGVGERLSHVSTGGGASLEMIAGEALPAVVALEVE